MHNFRSELGYVVLIISMALVSILATAIVVSPSQSASTTDNAVVIGAKLVYLSSRNDYIFGSGSSLVFEAPEKAGWTFDHMEIDFGCGVEGVRGSNVTKIFTIDNGYIDRCVEG